MLDISQDLTTVETDVWFYVGYGGCIYATEYQPECPPNPSQYHCVPEDVFGPFKMTGSIPEDLINKMKWRSDEKRAAVTLPTHFENVPGAESVNKRPKE